jgi:hypothetical protein
LVSATALSTLLCALHSFSHHLCWPAR